VARSNSMTIRRKKKEKIKNKKYIEPKGAGEKKLFSIYLPVNVV